MFSKSKGGSLFKKCSKPKVRPRPKPNYREPPPLNYPMYKEHKPQKYEELRDPDEVSSFEENTQRSSSSELPQPLYRSRSTTPNLSGEPSGGDSGYGGYSLSLSGDSLSLNAEDENEDAGPFGFSHREGNERLRSSPSVRCSRSSETLVARDEIIFEQDEVFLEGDENVYCHSSPPKNLRFMELEAEAESSGREADIPETSRGEGAALVNEPKEGRFVKHRSGKPNPRDIRHLLSAPSRLANANHTLSSSRSDGDLTVESLSIDQSSFSLSKEPLTSWRSCTALNSNSRKAREDSAVPTSEEEDDEVFPLHHASSNSIMERRKSVSFELPAEREVATYPPEIAENSWRHKDQGSNSSSFRKSWRKRLSKLSLPRKKSKSSGSGTPSSLSPTSSPLPFLKRKVFDFETLSLRSADSSHLSEYTGKFSSLRLNLERKKSSFPIEPTLTGFVHDNTEFPLKSPGNNENDSCSVASFASVESSASKLNTSPKITKFPLRKKCIYEVSPTEDVKLKLPAKPKRKGPIKAFKSLIGGSSKSTLDLSSLEKVSDSGISRSYDDILKENNFPTQEEYLVDPRMFTLSTDMMDLGDFDDDNDYYRDVRYPSRKDRHDTDPGRVTRKESDSNNIFRDSVSDGSFVNEMEHSFDIIRDRTLRKVSSKESAEEQEETAPTPKRKNSVHNMVTKFEELERRFSLASTKKQPLTSNKVKVMRFSQDEFHQKKKPIQRSLTQPILDVHSEEESTQVDSRTSRSITTSPSHDEVAGTKSGDETSSERVSRKKLNLSKSVQPRELSGERRPPPPRPPKPVIRKVESRVLPERTIEGKNDLERTKSMPVLNTESSLRVSKIIQNFEMSDEDQEVIKTACTDIMTGEKQNEEFDVELDTSVKEDLGCTQENANKLHEDEIIEDNIPTPEIRVEATSPLTVIEAGNSDIASYHLTVQKSSSVSSYEDFDKCSVGSTSSVDRPSLRMRTAKARKIPPKRPPPPKIPLERLHSYAQRAPKGDLTGVRVDAPLPDQPAPPKPPRLFHILSGHKKDFKNSDRFGSAKYRRFSIVDSEYDMIVAVSAGVGEMSSGNESVTPPATDVDMDENTYKRYPIEDSDEEEQELRMCGLKARRYSSHLFQLSNSTADTENDAIEDERFSSADGHDQAIEDERFSSIDSGHSRASVADRMAFFESRSVREGLIIQQELDKGNSNRERHMRGRGEMCLINDTDEISQAVEDAYPRKKENSCGVMQDTGDAEERVEERLLPKFPVDELNSPLSEYDNLKDTTWLVEGEARCIAIIPGPESISESEKASLPEPHHDWSSDNLQVESDSEKDNIVRAGNESCFKNSDMNSEICRDDSSRYESANSDSESPIPDYEESSPVKENESGKPTPSIRISRSLPVPRCKVSVEVNSSSSTDIAELESAECGESSPVPMKRSVVPSQIPAERTIVEGHRSQGLSSTGFQETEHPSRPGSQRFQAVPQGVDPSSGGRSQVSQEVPPAAIREAVPPSRLVSQGSLEASAAPRKGGPSLQLVSQGSQETPSAAPREADPYSIPRLQQPEESPSVTPRSRETGPSPGPRSLIFGPTVPPRPASVTSRPSSVLSCSDRPLLSLFFERLLETQQISQTVHSSSNSPEDECKSGDEILEGSKPAYEDSEQCPDMSRKDNIGMKTGSRPCLSRSNHELKTLGTITDEKAIGSEEQKCSDNRSGVDASPENPGEEPGGLRSSIDDECKYFKPISPSPPPRSLLSVQGLPPPSASPSTPPASPLPPVPPPVLARTKKNKTCEILLPTEEEDIEGESTGNSLQDNVPLEPRKIFKDEESYRSKDANASRNVAQDSRLEDAKSVKIRPVEILKRTRRRKMHKVRNEVKDDDDDDDSEGEHQRPPRPKPRRRLMRADAVQESSTSSTSTTSTSSMEDEEGHIRHGKDWNRGHGVHSSKEKDSNDWDTPPGSEVVPCDTITMVVEEGLSSPSVGISVRRASDSLLSLSLDQPKLRKSSCDLALEGGYSGDTEEELEVT